MPQLISDEITLVVTTCGRFDLLKQTISSFLACTDMIPASTILIDNAGNGTNPLFYKNEILQSLPNQKIIVNKQNIGQIRSIDKAYAEVNTEYIFHLEDDWLFYKYFDDKPFMAPSLSILKTIPNIINVNLRKRFDGTKGAQHPIINERHTTIDNYSYYLYEYNYNGLYHGFSFNPGLRRLADYKALGKYEYYGNEESIGKFYFENGYQAACLDECYCIHLGEYSVTPGANR